MANVMAEIKSFLITLVMVPGMFSLAFAVAYLAYQSAVFLLLRHPAEEVYRYRTQSFAEVRMLVTLPTISVVVAVIAGIGVNLATDAQDKGDVSTGVQLIFMGFVLISFIGLMMVVAHRPASPSRAVQIRLARIASALDDPFVSVERAVQLRAEVRRYMKVGERIAKRQVSTTFREWRGMMMAERDVKVSVVGAYGFAAGAMMLWVWRVLVTHGVTASAGRLTFLVFAISGGLLGTALHFHNYRQKCFGFGTLLQQRSRAVMANIDMLERKFGLPPIVNPPSGSPPPLTIRARLSRLWGAS
jgi:hypothetical protein